MILDWNEYMKVIIHMNNLFNGENELLANTVNKFLNDHGQEVLKEVKPAIRLKSDSEKFPEQPLT